MWSGKSLWRDGLLATTAGLMVAVCLSSCHDRLHNPNKKLSLSYYDSLSVPYSRLSYTKIKREVQTMVGNDSDSTLSDFYARKYYDGHGAFVWISRRGVSNEADSLFVRLQEIKSIGFNPKKFRIPEIEHDLERVHRLSFDKENPSSKVYARLEYNLTKALFRFAAGQRFGYTNPNNLLNRLDPIEETAESAGSFHQLYALESPRPESRFFRKALHQVRNENLSEFLNACEPQSVLYEKFKKTLNNDSARVIGNRLLLVNLERSRWRLHDYPWQHDKYVLVNLPSLHLTAVDKDRALSMRIGCGAVKTKTPLLSSFIARMDINPQWVMPKSIVRKAIVPHLGNVGWFASRHYFIRDRATGKNVSPANASADELLSGRLLAIQEGGEGNALGRIIFRFNNGLSIYLHDTSSKAIFGQDDRDVSHGCVRVEKPYQLAVFLLTEGNSKIESRIWYSMNADVSPLGKQKGDLSPHQRQVSDTLKRGMLIGNIKVEPAVPVYLWYYTLYPDLDGVLHSYKDIYSYDAIIYNYLKNYL